MLHTNQVLKLSLLSLLSCELQNIWVFKPFFPSEHFCDTSQLTCDQALFFSERESTNARKSAEGRGEGKIEPDTII